MKIRILFILDHFYATSGGTERQIYELIQGLDRSIFQVEACVFRQETDYLQREKFPCRMFSLGIGSFFDPSTYTSLHKLREYIQINEFDIVQTVFNDSAISVPPMTLGLKNKTISTRRDMGFWYTPIKLAALRINGLFTDGYLVNSFSVRENLHLREWVPLKKISVIYNGVDFSRFDVPASGDLYDQLCIPEGSPLVGIVANMRPVKRVGDLIRAFVQVVKLKPDAHLVIVGHLGQLYEEYSSLARHDDIEKKLHFLGMVQDPIPIIKRFTVGVNCSETEGLSNAVMEYMACGVPVVATDTSGNRELIKNHENGLLVSVGNTVELAQAVIQLLEDENLQGSIATNARECINKYFAQDRITAQYMKYYHEILGYSF